MLSLYTLDLRTQTLPVTLFSSYVSSKNALGEKVAPWENFIMSLFLGWNNLHLITSGHFYFPILMTFISQDVFSMDKRCSSALYDSLRSLLNLNISKVKTSNLNDDTERFLSSYKIFSFVIFNCLRARLLRCVTSLLARLSQNLWTTIFTILTNSVQNAQSRVLVLDYLCLSVSLLSIRKFTFLGDQSIVINN